MAEPKIFYLCKYHKDPHYCKHTSRIEDALNFSEVADGLYVENEIRKNNWIPVSVKLPEVSQRYLVYTKYDEVMTDFFMGDEFIQGDDIIAWQELPKPYKVGGQEE